MKTKNAQAAQYWEKMKDKNQDYYGQAVLGFAERWADLIEARIGDGEITEVAEKALDDANVESINDFMLVQAICILAHAWERGDELRRWHNLKYQINDEGERANLIPGNVLGIEIIEKDRRE